MNNLRHTPHNNHGYLVLGKCLFLFSLVFFGLGGCSIWNEDLDPDYQSSRADRLCHPFGQCSQGIWVPVNGANQDPSLAKNQCHDVVAQRYGNGEWESSVAKGLEIGRCMEKKGYRLQQ